MLYDEMTQWKLKVHASAKSLPVQAASLALVSSAGVDLVAALFLSTEVGVAFLALARGGLQWEVENYCFEASCLLYIWLRENPKFTASKSDLGDTSCMSLADTDQGGTSGLAKMFKAL
ncbi:hypothetical protein LX32DRAFT_688758 [Colletotrichum zoysiae]|uniref:Uncharacterized protein n=1 Tax=Colletotrichum zoysiae TaxID=1216348 RepID=A0AAD9M599_9PEZI|nr:hypothetical protein LX32DRAFT_688758 [Colletotrichum zoysiae]